MSDRISLEQNAFVSFVLTGKHAQTACERCHPLVTVAPDVQTRRYRPVPTSCEACHTDVHHGEFAGFAP